MLTWNFPVCFCGHSKKYAMNRGRMGVMDPALFLGSFRVRLTDFKSFREFLSRDFPEIFIHSGGKSKGLCAEWIRIPPGVYTELQDVPNILA